MPGVKQIRQRRQLKGTAAAVANFWAMRKCQAFCVLSFLYQQPCVYFPLFFFFVFCLYTIEYTLCMPAVDSPRTLVLSAKIAFRNALSRSGIGPAMPLDHSLAINLRNVKVKPGSWGGGQEKGSGGLATQKETSLHSHPEQTVYFLCTTALCCTTQKQIYAFYMCLFKEICVLLFRYQNN